MASKAVTTSTLTPVMTLEGHGGSIPCICYCPDGKQLISGSWDKTTRRWDLQVGKEIEEARDVYEHEVSAVAVSNDARWVVTVVSRHGGPGNTLSWGLNVKVRDVETGTKHFERFSRSGKVSCIDISTDNTLLANGMWDGSVQIRSLDTGKLVAGPLRCDDYVGAIRFSPDSKKLAAMSHVGKCLEVWDVETQTSGAKVGGYYEAATGVYAPVLWTMQSKSIVAAFGFSGAFARIIYEFDASTLETVGAPFKGHGEFVTGLSLSFDGVPLASGSTFDHTIKLWAFESRQLLSSFDIQRPHDIILSPNSHQLAYTTWADDNIHICDIPPDILATVWPPQETQTDTVAPHNPRLADLLSSNATRRAARRNLATSPFTPLPHPLRRSTEKPTIFRHIRPFLPYPFRSAVPPVRNDRPRDPLDFPATLPLPSTSSPLVQSTIQRRSHTDLPENSQPTPMPLRPVRALHAPLPVVDVPLAWGELRHAAAGAPSKDDDMIRDEGVPSPPPSPNPNSQSLAAVQINTGQHGSVLIVVARRMLLFDQRGLVPIAS
ncbi:hypothetical protein DEU56DRAFT_975973 [Suillus clintonianus]|uniref:uncharacterized protein n=1 Tax=Suillus clintonianus TaxID=1904413 RepID=UPI001B886729|nr:uncharacterized protein DEU56DRAFT_975973 [Suillus clintonianus]KAG2156407.1 hypothetical protein DEU56DRAFT_975973 [Suillus clintonianus]